MAACLIFGGRDDPLTGFGSHEMRGAREGDACTVRNPEYPDDQGAPGHLRSVGGQLVCVPDGSEDGIRDARQLAYDAYVRRADPTAWQRR